MSHAVFSRRRFLGSTAALGVAALSNGFGPHEARAAQGRITLFMLCDMEGTSGLFTRQQAWFDEKGVRPEVAEEGIQLLIADVNNAAEAALMAGVDRLIVCNTHLGGGNFRPKDMLADTRITYLYKSLGYEGRSFRWLPGLNETVDGLMLMGHHAKVARRLTATKVTEAIRKLHTARPAPYRPALPMCVAVRFESEAAAEAAAKKPGVRRTDAYTVECEVTRQCDVMKWLTGIGVGSEIVNRQILA